MMLYFASDIYNHRILQQESYLCCIFVKYEYIVNSMLTIKQQQMNIIHVNFK